VHIHGSVAHDGNMQEVVPRGTWQDAPGLVPVGGYSPGYRSSPVTGSVPI